MVKMNKTFCLDEEIVEKLDQEENGSLLINTLLQQHFDDSESKNIEFLLKKLKENKEIVKKTRKKIQILSKSIDKVRSISKFKCASCGQIEKLYPIKGAKYCYPCAREV